MEGWLVSSALPGMRNWRGHRWNYCSNRFGRKLILFGLAGFVLYKMTVWRTGLSKC